jgi:hypothetical protein
MPLLYGEGKRKAFHRLQEQILAISTDETIFAWNNPDISGGMFGLLADCPEWVTNCECAELEPFELSTSEWTMTNKGLRLQLLMAPRATQIGAEYTVYLNAVNPDNAKCPSFTLVDFGGDTYARYGCSPEKQIMFDTRARRLPIYVPQTPPVPKLPFQFRILNAHPSIGMCLAHPATFSA